MGNTPSDLSLKEPEDIWWQNEEKTQEPEPSVHVNFNKNSNLSEESIEEFDQKREKRKLILENKKQEIQKLREDLIRLRKENERLKEGPDSIDKYLQEIDVLQKENSNLTKSLEICKKYEMDQILEQNKELKMNISEMKSELNQLNLNVIDFEQEKQDYKRHVIALKDVIKVSKELLLIRENELNELQKKMKIIQEAFNEREASLMSDDLRREYERQLNNIRTLRDLYEERSRTYRKEATLLKSTVTEKNKELEDSSKKINELEERVTQLEKENSDKYDTIKTLESNLGLSKAERKQYQAELEVINQLFCNILLDFNNSPDLNLDKLLRQLEEHHGLLKEIVNNEICSQVSSSLPKVLLDLVNQISTEVHEENIKSEALTTITKENEPNSSSQHNLNSPAEIAENLPKVWRVLIELLSHQTVNSSEPENNEADDENRCYKTVVTPRGPSLVLSVSKTFLRLKELIIEKKSLERDMNNLKQLNSHLENRLQDQEKRFEVVSSELSKTWTFVGKLKKEHHLLHTQEQILRYELAQKRKLLTELKDELEYSREKWQQARDKNSKTEREWLILRKEFASRKKGIINEDGNNSVESGYSDEREESSDEEPGYETDISDCIVKLDCTEDAESKTTEPIDELPTNNEENVVVVPENFILNVIQDEITNISIDLDPNNETENEGSISSQIEISKENIEAEECSSEDKIKEINEQPSCSSTSQISLEERLAARDERLKRLEGQCKALVSQVTNTSNRSTAICNKLEDLHEIFGESSRNSTNDNSRNSTNENSRNNQSSDQNEENQS